LQSASGGRLLVFLGEVINFLAFSFNVIPDLFFDFVVIVEYFYAVALVGVLSRLIDPRACFPIALKCFLELLESFSIPTFEDSLIIGVVLINKWDQESFRQFCCSFNIVFLIIAVHSQIQTRLVTNFLYAV